MYRHIRNKETWVPLRRKYLKKHFKINTNKSYWKFIKKFILSSKGFIGCNDINLAKKNVVTIDKKTLKCLKNKS